MAREAFVQPESIRIDLPGGGWVEIKEKLSNGETKRLNGRGFTFIMDAANGNAITPVIDHEAFGMAKIEAWVVDWDMSQNDKVLPVSHAAIAQLDPDIAKEIEDAIDAHVEALGRVKNARSIGPGLELLSR